jgi:quinol monooxygenase YgiN
VGTEGCHGATLHRGIESRSRFVLLVQWESVEAHEQNFRGSERFATWRGAIGGFFASPPYVEHVTEI